MAKLFSTPDFGQSDLWQLNYPAKFALAKALSQNSIPLWNDQIATGFPQLAEGQTGVFNLMNLLIYKFLPFKTAINVGYFFIFLSSATGSYLYARLNKFSPPISLFAGVTFAYSGFFVSHVSHINFIHASSFLPFLFIALKLLLDSNKKLLWSSILALLLSQQYLAGFPQISLISLFGLGSYYLYRWFQKKSIDTSLLWPFLTLTLFIGLSAIQLLPSFEFLRISTRQAGFSLNQATFFSYPFKHLITFFNPYALGDPRRGTYPPFWETDGSIFWENTGYIGLLAFIAGLVSIIFLKYKKEVRFYWLLLFASLLLMMGRFSPLYFVYSIAPFSYFRVPSRFILLFVWAMVFLAAYSIKFVSATLSKKSRHMGSNFLMIFIPIALIQLFQFATTYNPKVTSSQFLSPPESAKYLSQKGGRYYVLDSSTRWNQLFTNTGWQNIDSYLFFKNELRPNMNVIYNLPAYQVYPIINTVRYDIFSQLIENNLQTESSSVKLGSVAKKMLSLAAVKHIISPVKLVGMTPEKIITDDANKKNSFYLYRNSDVLPRSYVVFKQKKVATVEEAISFIESDEFVPGESIIVDKSIDITQAKDEMASSTIITDRPEFVSVIAETSKRGYLVLADSIYPGWQATIDGKSTTVFAANINQKAVVIPPGRHVVNFLYKPKI